MIVMAGRQVYRDGARAGVAERVFLEDLAGECKLFDTAGAGDHD